MRTNEGYVYIALRGDNFDPNAITSFLGVDPTSTTRKGERVPGKVPRHNTWKLSTERIVHDYIDVYDLSASVVSLMYGKEVLLAEARVRFDATIVLQVVLYFVENDDIPTPAIGFSVETLSFLAKVGASIDIDTYRIGPE